MNILDKIGRDQAKLLLEHFAPLTKGDEAKVEVIKRSKLYKYFIGRKEDGKTKVVRDDRDTSILIPLELNALRNAQVLDEAGYTRLHSMSQSSDTELKELCKTTVNELRLTRLKKEQDEYKAQRSMDTKLEETSSDSESTPVSK